MSKRRWVAEQLEELKWSVLALYLARKDPRIPFCAKIAIALAVGYVLSPIDLVPDFIPILGYLDDIFIVPGLVSYAVNRIPDEVLDEYKEKAREEFKEGSPKAWRAAVIIVFIWALFLAMILSWFLL